MSICLFDWLGREHSSIKITIAGGKGGTGKITVAVNLCAFPGRHSGHVVDRDVIGSMKAGRRFVELSEDPAAEAVQEIWNNVLSFLAQTQERLI